MPVRAGTALPFATGSASRSSIGYGLGALAVGLAVAAIGLWYRRLPGFVRDGAVRVAGPPLELVRNAHTGIVGDYLLWIVAGTALIGGIWAFTPP